MRASRAPIAIRRRKMHACEETGKLRYRDWAQAQEALLAAVWDRQTAQAHNVASHRREVRAYPCGRCNGWHLTSQGGDRVAAAPLRAL